jgi:hypothetical protein
MAFESPEIHGVTEITAAGDVSMKVTATFGYVPILSPKRPRGRPKKAAPDLERYLPLIAAAAARFDVTVDQVLGPERTWQVSSARFEAIRAVHEAHPNLSWPDLGRLFRRHHASIMNALGASTRGASNASRRTLWSPKPPQPPREYHGVSHEAVLAMLAEGATLEQAGLKLGVTRERVRQIAKKHGVTSARARDKHAALRAQIRAALLAGEEPASIQQRLGASPSTITALKKAVGLGARSLRERECRERFAPFVEMVRQGRSITSVEREFQLPRGVLSRESQRQGVASKARSRWRDLSHRYSLIPQWRAEGVGWDEITARLERIEGRPLATVYSWAFRHFPDLFQRRSRRHP